PRALALIGGPAKDPPVPTVVGCRKRQQDVAPVEGLSYEHPQRYLQVGAVSSCPDLRGVSYRWMEVTPALIGRRRSTMCSSLMRRARSYWPRRSRMTRRGLRSLCRALVRLGVVLVAVERP